jgi:putative transport protein
MNPGRVQRYVVTMMALAGLCLVVTDWGSLFSLPTSALLGLAGLIAIIKLLPGMLGIDLKKQSAELESQEEGGEAIDRNYSTRAFRAIDKKATTFSYEELQKRFWDKTAVVRVVRGGEVLTKDDSDHLQLGDEIYVLAST